MLASKGQSSFGTDQDDFILIPLRTLQRRIAGNNDVSAIYISARDRATIDKTKEDITKLLRERRHIPTGEADDFHVRDMQEIMTTLTGTTRILTTLLGAVAAVSLLVGGIGIMNIMLVSVTERTREIGIRLAIGALGSEVLLQFLVEAVVLSTFGGVVGIILGLSTAAARGPCPADALRAQPADRRHRLSLLGGGGGDLRLFSGQEGRPPGPHRGVAPRVIHFHKKPITTRLLLTPQLSPAC